MFVRVFVCVFECVCNMIVLVITSYAVKQIFSPQ